MAVSPHRSSFEVVVTAMLAGCLAGAALGATAGLLAGRPAPDLGLLAGAGLIAGCAAGALAGTAWCVARRRRRAAPEATAAPAVDAFDPPADRRPGWHTDPAGSRRLWDGERWTDHVWAGRRD